MSNPPTRLARLAPAAACAALAVAVLWPALTPKLADRLYIGGGGEDFLRQVYPWRAFVAATWAAGKIPLWNPHQYAGTPALADPQLAVLYPWRLLQIPFALGGRTLPLWTVTLEAAGHLALGALFTAFLARRLGASRPAAALAGATFGAGGYLTGYPIVQLPVLDTAVWLPATLAALVGATSAGDAVMRRRWAAAAAMATALAVFAGHAQTAGYVVVAGALWLAAAIRRSLGRDVASTSGASPHAVGSIALIWLGGAAALSAVQWWPTLELVRQASRTLSAGEVLAGLPARDVVQLVAPHVVSRWSPLYVGIVPLVVAAWGALRARTGRGWVALAIGAWLFALGGNGPLFPILLRIAPVFATFRHQERAAVLVALALAVAAALSLDEAIARRVEVGRVFAVVWAAATVGAFVALRRFGAGDWADALTFTALVAVAAAVVCLAPRRFDARVATLALVAITVFDLLSVNRGHALAPADPAAVDASLDPRAAALAPHARDGRVSSEGRLAAGPNAASVLGLYDVTGDSPLHFKSIEDLVTTAPEIVWWKILGVRYAVTEARAGAEGLLKPLRIDDARVGAGLVPALPPADPDPATGTSTEGEAFEVQLPGRMTWVASADDVVTGTWRPAADFDPFGEVVVQSRSPSTVPRGGLVLDDEPSGDWPMSEEWPAAGEARVTGIDPSRVVVDVNLSAEAYVVLSTAYDEAAGWRVRAESWAQPLNSEQHHLVAEPSVIKAYDSIMAVHLPPALWRIEWTYRPRSVTLGALVGLLGLIGLVAVTMYDPEAQRRRAGANGWPRLRRPRRT